MKRLSILILVLCTVAVAQTKDRLSVNYDRFKDRTTVSVDFLPLSISNRPRNTPVIGLSVSASYPGKTIAQPERVQLAFIHRNWTTRSTSEFNGDPKLILLIDGERFTIENVEYGGSTVDLELAWANVTLHDLRRLANATRVEGQLGSLGFRLTPEQHKAIALLVDYFSKPLS